MTQIPPYPHQAGAQYAMQPDPAPSNGMGMAGFIVSLIGLLTCGLLAPIGLLLSLLGLLKRPRGFALAGLIISVIGTVLLVAVGWGMVKGWMGLKKFGEEIGNHVETQQKATEAVQAI